MKKRLDKAIVRVFFMFGLSIFAILFFDGPAVAAEKYPSKPINFIIAVEAGSDGDVLSRPLIQKASSILGSPIVVVNKPGAGSSIGYREIHDAKPDGYTIGWTAGTIITNRLQGILPYDYRDYTIICSFLINVPGIVASTKTKRPFNTFEEVITFAKSHPGEVSIASSGVGQMYWVFLMALLDASGLKFNVIPQPGGSGFVISQVAGGHTDLGTVAIPAAKGQMDAGNVRALATFGPRRPLPPYDYVPNLKEFGYEVNLVSTQAVMGPPKMPKEITDKLVKLFEAAANDPEYLKFAAERNALPFYLPPAQAFKHLEEQRALFREAMGKAGILKVKD